MVDGKLVPEAATKQQPAESKDAGTPALKIAGIVVTSVGGAVVVGGLLLSAADAVANSVTWHGDTANDDSSGTGAVAVLIVCGLLMGAGVTMMIVAKPSAPAPRAPPAAARAAPRRARRAPDAAQDAPALVIGPGGAGLRLRF